VLLAREQMRRSNRIEIPESNPNVGKGIKIREEEMAE
jgi:hypothetical protein